MATATATATATSTSTSTSKPKPNDFVKATSNSKLTDQEPLLSQAEQENNKGVSSSTKNRLAQQAVSSMQAKITHYYQMHKVAIHTWVSRIIMGVIALVAFYCIAAGSVSLLWGVDLFFEVAEVVVLQGLALDMLLLISGISTIGLMLVVYGVYGAFKYYRSKTSERGVNAVLTNPNNGLHLKDRVTGKLETKPTVVNRKFSKRTRLSSKMREETANNTLYRGILSEDDKREHRGLHNGSNGCFMNADLQALKAIKHHLSFADFDDEKSVEGALQEAETALDEFIKDNKVYKEYRESKKTLPNLMKEVQKTEYAYKRQEGFFNAAKKHSSLKEKLKNFEANRGTNELEKFRSKHWYERNEKYRGRLQAYDTDKIENYNRFKTNYIECNKKIKLLKQEIAGLGKNNANVQSLKKTSDNNGSMVSWNDVLWLKYVYLDCLSHRSDVQEAQLVDLKVNLYKNSTKKTSVSDKNKDTSDLNYYRWKSAELAFYEQEKSNASIKIKQLKSYEVVYDALHKQLKEKLALVEKEVFSGDSNRNQRTDKDPKNNQATSHKVIDDKAIKEAKQLLQVLAKAKQETKQKKQTCEKAIEAYEKSPEFLRYCELSFNYYMLKWCCFNEMSDGDALQLREFMYRRLLMNSHKDGKKIWNKPLSSKPGVLESYQSSETQSGYWARQQDANEFLVKMWDHLGLPQFKSAIYRTYTNAQNESRDSNVCWTDETGIELELPANGGQLSELMSGYLQEKDQESAEDTWFDSGDYSKGHCTTIKQQVTLDELPNVLRVGLKRFGTFTGYRDRADQQLTKKDVLASDKKKRESVLKKMEKKHGDTYDQFFWAKDGHLYGRYPAQLIDMNQYKTHQARQAFCKGKGCKLDYFFSKKRCNVQLNNFTLQDKDGNEATYKPKVAILHHGASPNMGHYTAVVNDSADNTFWFDDKSVTKNPQQHDQHFQANMARDVYVVICEKVEDNDNNG